MCAIKIPVCVYSNLSIDKSSACNLMGSDKRLKRTSILFHYVCLPVFVENWPRLSKLAVDIQ